MLKIQHLLLLILVVVFGASAVAQESQKKRWEGVKKQRSQISEMDFEAMKQKRSDNLGLQIEQLSIYKACIDAAADQVAVATCTRANREALRSKLATEKTDAEADGPRKRYKDKSKQSGDDL